MEAGPNTGGQNNAGAFVTIYGHRFGSAQSSSYISIGGGRAASYPLWSDTKVTFQLGSLTQTGGITVTTSAGTSSSLPFTVQAGNIHFVSTSGSDSAAGSYTAPWRTLLQARNAMQAGDITYAMNGVAQTSDDGEGWAAALTLRPEWCGTSGSPRALIAYPGATVTIGNPSGGSPENGLRSVDFSAGGGACGGNWVFGELQFRGISPVSINGPSNQWRFVGNDITCPNSSGSGGGGACFETTLASNVKFYGNNVHDAGTANASALFQGVYFSTDSNHIDMGWNSLTNVHGCRGLQIHSSPLGSGYPNSGYPQYDIAIHHNLIHDTQCDGIIADTIDPSKGPISIYGNVIYNAGKGPNNPEGSGAWNCVNIPGNVENGTSGGGTVNIFNNTMYACGTFTTPPYGEANAGIQEGGGATNLYVNSTNNLINQTSTSLFPTGAPYVIAWDPTIANGGGVCNPGSACPWIAGTRNLFWGSGGPPFYPGLTASVNADPLFINIGQYDFHLNSASPAATAGVATAMKDDMDGILLGSTYPIGAYAVGNGASAPSVNVTVNPSTASLTAAQMQQFTATVTGTSQTGVTWTLSPQTGTISSAGLYTAPAPVPSVTTVKATVTSTADKTKSAIATITLNPASAVVTVAVAPGTASLQAGQQQQFTSTVTGSSNTAITWTLSPAVGTLSGTGLYTAPASITSTQTVRAIATSVADATKSSSATITLNPPAKAVSVAVTPGSISLLAGQQQQFSAAVTGSTNTAVTWSLSADVGALSAAGLYTAPSTVAASTTVTAIATSVADSSKTGQATITLTPVTTTPPPSGGFSVSCVALGNGQLQVNWTAPSGRPAGDNINLASPGAPNWWYLNEHQVSGTSGSYTIAAPAAPGDFEFRYYPAGTNTVAARSSVLAENTASFSLKPKTSTVAKGSSISLAFTASAGRPGGWNGDSIVMYPAGGSDDNPKWQGYPQGKASGTLTLTAPSTAGTYVFDYMISGNGYISAAQTTIIVQ